jgi:predicted amidohydrolase
MKACIIQPQYSTDYARSDELFAKEIEYLRACDDTMDIIVMPESCDCPALARTKEQSEQSSKKYRDILLDEASKTAKRCNAIVFLNARSEGERGELLNTTYAFDRSGTLAGKYFKQHLVPSEFSVMQLESDYTFECSEPTVIEIDGIRFAFLVCYDFYFYEAFSNIARQNVDVIIGCSHQRSDTHRALTVMSQFLAYNTNAYVLRSSVSMDESSDIGGASMIVAPDGEVLLNMEKPTLSSNSLIARDRFG